MSLGHNQFPKRGRRPILLSDTAGESIADTNPGEPQGLDHLPAVITTAEAAAALRVGVREIRQLIESGQLPAARLGPRRVIRIRRDALLGLLAGASAPRGARDRRRPMVPSQSQTGGALQAEE